MRDQFPSTSKYARRGVDNYNGANRPPAESTRAAPGSEAKIAEMCRRAERGESLFHDADGVRDNEEVPTRPGGQDSPVGYVRTKEGSGRPRTGVVRFRRHPKGYTERVGDWYSGFVRGGGSV